MLILLIDDHQAIRDMLALSLRRAHYQVIAAASASEGRTLATQHQPELAIIDWMLPDGSGPDVIRWLRKQPTLAHIPILMLTARTTERDAIAGLDAGADDYVSKPFGIAELLARMRALARRVSHTPDDGTLQLGAIRIDPKSRQVRVNDKDIVLTQTLYRLLSLFAENPQRIWSRQQILTRVWEHNENVDLRTVDVHVLRLRKLLQSHGLTNLIETVRGSGYRCK